MKNKIVCKRCHISQSLGWEKFDEELWKQNRVYCPCIKWSINIVTTDIEKCPYKLEHLVIENEKKI